jgi:hypothetical protein
MIRRNFSDVMLAIQTMVNMVNPSTAEQRLDSYDTTRDTAVVEQLVATIGYLTAYARTFDISYIPKIEESLTAPLMSLNKACAKFDSTNEKSFDAVKSASMWFSASMMTFVVEVTKQASDPVAKRTYGVNQIDLEDLQ